MLEPMKDPAAFLQKAAQQAFRRREFVELPFRGGALERFRFFPDLAEGMIVDSERRRAIVDAHWAAQKGKYFDGSLVGVTSLSSDAASVRATYTEIRYRDYLAADRVLAEGGEVPTPLAIGIHCLIRHSDEVAVLLDSKGRPLVPGGAVDMTSMAGDRPPLASAIHNELLEEAGFKVEHQEVVITRVFVGGYPTHVLCMTVLEIRDEETWRALSQSGHRADAEDIVGVETIPLTTLIACRDTLSLMTRTTLDAYLSWRGGAEWQPNGPWAADSDLSK